ncbi:hypothetical protein [Agromyces bracchium]|uniref:Uncharacterized protein n=1 Tax=Agromyces bracchium TaxID=88376 RepID=A0A6I3M708_9MICO|nr:hypothetical protein [Agromyces bracchium]MTH68518.1 hypothetical protein [Agromyces bracchium]
MTDRWNRIRCPNCGETSAALVTVVPTMGDAGLAVTDYRCPSGCRLDELHAEIDEALGIRHVFG